MARTIDHAEATTRLRTARRVAVFGVSGAGKSTFSMRLAEWLGVAYVSLDRDMRWLPGWTVRDPGEQRRLHERHVASDDWVIDGTSVSLMKSRLGRADVAVWMRPSRPAALWGIYCRVVRGYGRVRKEMAEGCPEQLPDREFLTYVWTFERVQSPRIEAALARHGPDLPLVTIHSRREADAILRSL